MYNLSVYDNKFYDLNQREGIAMAEWIVPALIDIFKPTSVIDVGCGTGHYLKKFIDLGIPGFGIEGSDAAIKNTLCPGKVKVIKEDLRTVMIQDPMGEGLCISFEVAEHLEPEYAENYVRFLCKCSDTVVITAARPGQGGEHHVNEQPAEYWKKLFAAKGFRYDGDKSAQIAELPYIAAKAGHFVAGYMYITSFLVFTKVR